MDDVLPYYKKSENYHRGPDEYHSDQGEMLVQEQRLKWEVLETFKKVCQESGFIDRPDFNRGDNSGVGYFEVTQKRGPLVVGARVLAPGNASTKPEGNDQNLDRATHL